VAEAFQKMIHFFNDRIYSQVLCLPASPMSSHDEFPKQAGLISETDKYELESVVFCQLFRASVVYQILK
jgi:hypothetical protein